MSLFKGIEGEKVRDPNAKDIYFTPGDYLLQIVKIKGVKATKRGGKEGVRVEAKVMEADGEGALPEGTVVAYFINASWDSFLKNVKVLGAALTGKPASEITEAVMDKIAGDENPAAGEMVRARMTGITTKSGSPFTKAEWFSA